MTLPVETPTMRCPERRLHLRAILALTFVGLALGCTDSTSSGPVPAQLEFTVQPLDATAGVAISPSVAVAIEDAGGNTITSATAEVTLTIGAHPGDGTLSGTVTVAAINGVATFPNLRITRAGTGYTVKAAAAGLPAAESRGFDIIPGPARAVRFTAQPGGAMQGISITPPVVVTAQDSVGNPATGFGGNVTVALVGGGGIPATLAGTTIVGAVNGVATFSTLSIGQVGNGFKLMASAGSLAGDTTAAFNVGPPGATLHITTVTGGSALDPDGYEVCLDNDPYANGCGQSSAIPSTGTVSVTTDSGTHTVLLAGVAANCTVAGGNSRSVHAALGEIVAVRYTITCSAGTLRVTTTTTGVAFDPNGFYQLCIDPGYYYGCSASSAAIGVNASLSIGLTPGTHVVELDGVPTNCKLQGDNPRTVTVPTATDIAFAVNCFGTGSLRITTSTRGTEIDQNGYSVCVDPSAGACFASVQVPATGAITLSDVTEGSHTVTLSALAENCAIVGAAERTVAVPRGGSVAVAFDVECRTAERVAFSVGGEIEMVRTDGVALQSITPGTAPAWSPDGVRLAYECGQDICVVNADGTGASRLTLDGAGNHHPTWSPDGSKIAFVATHAGEIDLYTMSADGTDAARVTNGGLVPGSPAWSPDGTRIAFDCAVDAGNWDLCVVNVDGTGFARLTTDPAQDGGAAWKPDGSVLAFATTRFGPSEIALMSPAGGSVTRFGGGTTGFAPTWSPDGTRLAIVQIQYGYYGDPFDYIMVVRADGSNLHYLLPGDQPAWKPHP
jgi:hypothetical protein